jgi:hypothetical protein
MEPGASLLVGRMVQGYSYMPRVSQESMGTSPREDRAQ